MNLNDMYSILYPNHTITHVPRKHFVFSTLRMLGEHFLSINSHSQRSPAIMAYWGCPPPNSPTGIRPLKIGIVDYFFIHTAVFPNSTEKKTHLFAEVKWFQEHIRPFHFHQPLRLVCTLFEPENKHSFIPVSRLLCRCAITPKLSLAFDYGVDNAIVVCPYFIAHANLSFKHCHIALRNNKVKHCS